MKHQLALRGIANRKNAIYDAQTIEVMRRVLRPDSGCIDIGAHKGSILKEILNRAANGSHYAFEPLPHLAEELKNRFPSVNVYQVALSDKAGESEFYYVTNAPGYSGLRRRIYDRPDPIIEKIRVSVTTLDEAIPEYEGIDFIKVDIEGGEFHAIRGGIRTILRSKAIIVFEAGEKAAGQ
jgi:FkbM family methyltransferase